VVRPHPDSQGIGGATKVIVLADSFTSFTEPAIGQAAIELLRLAGYEVELESSVCCGRPQLSKGLLDDAKKTAGALIDRLAAAAASGTRIVGWEPSCILTLGDDHHSLFPDDPRVATIAAQSGLVDELLLEAIRDGRLLLDEHSSLEGKRVVFHGHCHQKAAACTQAVRLVGVDAEALVAIRLVVAEVPLPPPGLGVPFEGEHVGGDAIEEPPVVADHDGTTGEGQQRVLERPQRVDVEIVGRLVEQQDVAAAASAPWPAAPGCARRPRAGPPSSAGRSP
jgi:hypothetical protein